MLTQIELLKKYDLKIRGHLGQHLLMDPNTVRKIVDALDLQPGDRVFEIGPGLGAVTREVLARGFPLLAVEKDKRFVDILNAELVTEHAKNFKLIHEDVLKADLTKIIQEWQEKGTGTFLTKEKGACPPVKVIGNLPYYISTPILFHLIEHAKIFLQAVLMLQKEVALRLSAQPGEEDYSRLSLTGRLYGKTKFLFDVSPSCFLPRPQVMSRVVSFHFRPFPTMERLQNKASLLEIIRIAFGQRRKTLFSILAHQFKSRISRKGLEHIFESLGLSLQARGETLPLETFIALAEALN